MKTLVYDPFNSEILELLSNDEEIDVKFSIHSLKGVKKDLFFLRNVCVFCSKWSASTHS